VAGVPQDVIDNSIEYGHALAGALIPWAEADGYDNIRYKGYIAPAGVDKWVSTGFSDKAKVANPTEPYFGNLRLLVMNTPDECGPAGPKPFSADPASAFYAEAAHVHATDDNLTDEQREIARFWADPPVDTGTPAAHWINIATKFVRPLTLDRAVVTYAMQGIAFYDAFISCWYIKFKYNLLRPETYIRRYIQSDWVPLMPTPQFPTYASGHSTESGANAVVLTQLFGPGPFVDDTKLRRGFAPHNFASFHDAALEAAISREYGGIHYPMDDDDGVVAGECIGGLVVSRVHMAP
jgi:hypothetical protein